MPVARDLLQNICRVSPLSADSPAVAQADRVTMMQNMQQYLTWYVRGHPTGRKSLLKVTTRMCSVFILRHAKHPFHDLYFRY